MSKGGGGGSMTRGGNQGGYGQQQGGGFGRQGGGFGNQGGGFGSQGGGIVANNYGQQGGGYGGGSQFPSRGNAKGGLGGSMGSQGGFGGRYGNQGGYGQQGGYGNQGGGYGGGFGNQGGGYGGGYGQRGGYGQQSGYGGKGGQAPPPTSGLGGRGRYGSSQPSNPYQPAPRNYGDIGRTALGGKGGSQNPPPQQGGGGFPTPPAPPRGGGGFGDNGGTATTDMGMPPRGGMGGSMGGKGGIGNTRRGGGGFDMLGNYDSSMSPDEQSFGGQYQAPYMPTVVDTGESNGGTATNGMDINPPRGGGGGGRNYTDPTTGNEMYQPPMPTVPEGTMQSMVMPPAINTATGQPNPFGGFPDVRAAFDANQEQMRGRGIGDNAGMQPPQRPQLDSNRPVNLYSDPNMGMGGKGGQLGPPRGGLKQRPMQQTTEAKSSFQNTLGNQNMRQVFNQPASQFIPEQYGMAIQPNNQQVQQLQQAAEQFRDVGRPAIPQMSNALPPRLDSDRANRDQMLRSAMQAPDIQGAETGMPGSFGYLSPEEKSRREKGYQDRMASQQKFMDENPLVPQVQNLDAQLLGGPNDPSSENYIDPRIEMREIKRQQQAEYDASDEARQRNMANESLMLDQRMLEQTRGMSRGPGQYIPQPPQQLRRAERPVLRGIGSMGQGRRR